MGNPEPRPAEVCEHKHGHKDSCRNHRSAIPSEERTIKKGVCPKIPGQHEENGFGKEGLDWALGFESCVWFLCYHSLAVQHSAASCQLPTATNKGQTHLHLPAGTALFCPVLQVPG